MRVSTQSEATTSSRRVVTTLGLAFSVAGQAGSTLALGWSRDLLLRLPADSCIDIETPGVCAPIRPDHPVAWRGDVLEDADALLALAAGWCGAAA